MIKTITKYRLLLWLVAIIMRFVLPVWNEPLSLLFWSLCVVAASIDVYVSLGFKKLLHGLFMVGLASNATAVLSNNGRMPVQGWSVKEWGSMGAMWQLANEHTRFLFLSDIHPIKHVGFFSVGDVIIGVYILSFILYGFIQSKIKKV